MILLFTLLISTFFLGNIEIYSYALNDPSNSSPVVNNENNTSNVKVGNMTINVLLAQTPIEQSKGLAIKDSLNEDEGMLFIFDTPKKYSFWMKDMKFPIDIIWLNTEGKIVHIEKNLKPCFFLLPCPSYSPPYDSLYVLEVVSNYTNKYDIKVGDQIQIETLFPSGKSNVTMF
jgi:uncharacterized protein